MMKTDLASNTHLDRFLLSAWISNLKNASIVSGTGELIFSQDPSPLKTTTSRLVVFQIFKKYLQLKPGSAAICNDPMNGGTDFETLFICLKLSENLCLVWEDQCGLLNFKIPPMPWLENSQENTVFMGALIAASSSPQVIRAFLDQNKAKADHFLRSTEMIQLFSNPQFKSNWFKTCLAIFRDKMAQRAEGETQRSLEYKGLIIKMRVSITEDQNTLPFAIDFSGTSMAGQLSAATHIIESGLLIELIKFYGLEGYLCQSILNSIKLTLPPNSIVAKPTPDGAYNFELQKVSRQLIRQCLGEINSTQRKEVKRHSTYSTYLIAARPDMLASTGLQDLKNQEAQQLWSQKSYFSNSRVQMIDGPFVFERKQALEKSFDCAFKPKQPLRLVLRGVTSPDDISVRRITLNRKPIVTGEFLVTPEDLIEIFWTT